MAVLRRLTVLAVLGASVLAGCNKSVSNDVPLHFVPADTAYVFGNLEPLPQSVLDRWSAQMHELWPVIMPQYQQTLDAMAALDSAAPVTGKTVPAASFADARRVLQAILDEVKPRDTIDRLRELGFKPDGHFAFYGVGVVPVLRVELGDVEGFKAFLARVQQKSGKQMDVGKLGTQDYFSIAYDKVQILLAIENHQLVLTFCPLAATDDLRRTLLGLNVPDKNVLDSGVLTALNQKYHYLASGSGFLDIVRLTDLISDARDPVFLQFSQALGSPATAVDADCQHDFHSIALQVPRLTMGAEAQTAQRMQVAFQIELEAALAQDVMASVGTAPGTASASDGLVDVSLSVPVLKLKDFWQRRIKAVADKPFVCSALLDLNKQAVEAQSKLDTTVPPPISDLYGLRIMLTRLELKGTGIPDFAGKALLGLNTPMTSVAMAQLALPSLKDLKIQPDGKPVPVPLGTMGAGMPPVFAALSDRALALSFGPGEENTLTAFLNAPAASQPVFMRASFSGAIYGIMGKFWEVLAARMDAKQRAQLAQSAQSMTLMQNMLRRIEMRFTATPDGVLVEETVDMN